ncbi:hypothetical protein JQC91_06915 [Jannaschia sp. Os4]|uniref:hypothetical protein n=1 Tax=Jannaschia sp. Os4 TaxID=2807617 RepID=UPI001939F953|nr:hypothetical protein [Jannaschia sp. Os4]MBM2576030.1 hypothetical protein [Jannaschia sp. Os4]
MDLGDVLQWVAAVCVIAATIMVSVGRPKWLVVWAFVLYVVASAAWVWTGFVNGMPALLAQNAVLLCINLWGLARWKQRAEAEESAGAVPAE